MNTPRSVAYGWGVRYYSKVTLMQRLSSSLPASGTGTVSSPRRTPELTIAKGVNERRWNDQRARGLRANPTDCEFRGGCNSVGKGERARGLGGGQLADISQPHRRCERSKLQGWEGITGWVGERGAGGQVVITANRRREGEGCCRGGCRREPRRAASRGRGGRQEGKRKDCLVTVVHGFMGSNRLHLTQWDRYVDISLQILVCMSTCDMDHAP